MRGTCRPEQRGQPIAEVDERRDIPVLRQPPRPVEQHGHLDSALIHRALGTVHAAVEASRVDADALGHLIVSEPECGAIVGGKHDHGVVRNAVVVQRLLNRRNTAIHHLDHGVGDGHPG